MNRDDFVNLVADYASRFMVNEEDGNKTKFLCDFVNFVAANQGINYGIYVEELKTHKDRVYKPDQALVIQELIETLSIIYLNSNQPQVQAMIETVGRKYSSGLQRKIELYKD